MLYGMLKKDTFERVKEELFVWFQAYGELLRKTRLEAIDLPSL